MDEAQVLLFIQHFSASYALLPEYKTRFWAVIGSMFQPRFAQRRLWTAGRPGEVLGPAEATQPGRHPISGRGQRVPTGVAVAVLRSQLLSRSRRSCLSFTSIAVASAASPGVFLCCALGAGGESVRGVMAGRPRLTERPGALLEMTAFVSALPAVAAHPLAAADGRRCVAAGAPAQAAAVQRPRPHGLSMVAAGKGPAGAKTDSSGRKPFVNDSYISVPTERIRNLSIIAHIDHGTCVEGFWAETGLWHRSDCRALVQALSVFLGVEGHLACAAPTLL